MVIVPENGTIVYVMSVGSEMRKGHWCGTNCQPSGQNLKTELSKPYILCLVLFHNCQTITRMHSSRMRTARSLTVSDHIPCTHPRHHACPPTTMHAPCNHACPPATMHTPLQPHTPPTTMHAPHNHTCPPQPRIPPTTTHAPCNHAHPPCNHACPPQPHMPPCEQNDWQTGVKT